MLPYVRILTGYIHCCRCDKHLCVRIHDDSVIFLCDRDIVIFKQLMENRYYEVRDEYGARIEDYA